MSVAETQLGGREVGQMARYQFSGRLLTKSSVSQIYYAKNGFSLLKFHAFFPNWDTFILFLQFLKAFSLQISFLLTAFEVVFMLSRVRLIVTLVHLLMSLIENDVSIYKIRISSGNFPLYTIFSFFFYCGKIAHNVILTVLTICKCTVW